MRKSKVEPVAQPVYTERHTCRACGSKTLVSVLDLGVHYLPRFVEEPDDTLPKSPLHLVQCALCGLLQLQHTVDPDLLYREFYYRSGINQTMRDALRDLVFSAGDFHDEGAWLDIGANDGTLLSMVPENFVRISCEPAANFTAQLQEHSDVVVPNYFSEKAIRDLRDDPVQVITSAACFYDVDNPSDFVRDIAGLLSKDGVWINQLNDAGTMMKTNAVDSICHEHLCYYSVPALRNIYQAHGLKIVRITFNDVNGGSVRVFAMKDSASGGAVDLIGLYDVGTGEAQSFSRRIKKWRDQMRFLLKGSMRSRGPIYGYGASTKMGTILQYLDCDDSFLAVADRNPSKVGKFTVGSWLPIVSEADLRKAKPDYCMVFPYAFRSEFHERESALREAGTTFVYPLPDISFVV